MTIPDEEIERAVSHLAAGGVVAVATESFFGLLADVTRQDALEAVFSLKPRGADKGVPLLLPAPSHWSTVALEIPPLAVALANAFWPGPLSIAVKARADVDPRIALGGTVAVRVPGKSPAAVIAQRVGVPLTASSANKPGEPPATDAQSVKDSFHDAVAAGLLLVVSGTSPGGAPSTVVVVDGPSFTIAREAAVPRARIEAVATSFAKV